MLWSGIIRPLWNSNENQTSSSVVPLRAGVAVTPRPHMPSTSGGSQRRGKVERRLAAILGADIRNYSGLMLRDEDEMHRRVGTEMRRISREIEKSHGRVFSFAGDGLMAEFPSAVEALKCALRIQAEAGRLNADLARDAHLRWRVGVNAGEIIVQDDRSGGHAVNVAARLEQIAEPGGICISASVFEQVHRVLPIDYRSIGPQKLKNMRDPVLTYAVSESVCLAWKGVPALPRLASPIRREDATDYRSSLAVLPFRTLSADHSDAYFGEGIVEDIIRFLGGLKELLVISRSSTLGLVGATSGAPVDLRRIGHDLDVQYVLQGSVRRNGDVLRIGVELCEAQNGRIIWSDRFDGKIADLFDFQDEIAVNVATSIAPHIREIELGRALRKHPANMTAYDLTLQALDHLYRNDRAALATASELLHQAVTYDPFYGPAFSHTAYLHLIKVGQGWSDDLQADHEAAVSAARKAIDLDRSDALALSIYGHIMSFLFRDYATAMTYLDQARAVGPSCAWAWTNSSFTAGYRGEIDAAVEFAEHGVRLAPLGLGAFRSEHALSQAYYLAGRYGDAVAWGRLSRSHGPYMTSNLRVLVTSLVANEELAEARLIAADHMRIDPLFRLSVFAARTPLPGQVRGLFVERLRVAGMPD